MGQDGAVVPAPAAPYVGGRATVMNQEIRFCATADGLRLAYALSGKGPPLAMSATWLTHLEHQWRSLV